MKVDIVPGKYVVAVSGGVDSMVLLHILVHTPGLELVVVHYEHGIRSDSDDDRELVQQTAEQYGLPFVYEHGNLGVGASEAIARERRYEFLRRVLAEQGAQAIITAHHRDDLIETAILNLLRGTGRLGLSSLRSTDEILRPLLNFTKHDIYDYAAKHQTDVVWSVDSTNSDDRYLRNYVRQHIIRQLGDAGKELLVGYISAAQVQNPIINTLLLHELHEHSDEHNILERTWFAQLPHAVASEMMASWLREQGVTEFDRLLIERLVVYSKVLQPGKTADINAAYYLKVEKRSLQVLLRSPS